MEERKVLRKSASMFIHRLTGIVFDPYEGEPGALELQGDHGAAQFRNIVVTPLTHLKK